MLPSWIIKYVGLPFEVRGRSAKGLDCWGLALLVYQQELGIRLEDHSDHYERTTDSDQIEKAGLVERLSWTKVDDPRPLDIVVFNIFGRPVHVGIVISDHQFLHSPEDDYTRIERFTDRTWVRRVEGFYRHVTVPCNR